MLVLSALCVLLPLAAALNTCDESTAKAFLAKKQLKGNLLDNFGDQKYWFVASGTEGSDSSSHSSEISFDRVIDNSVVVNYVHRDSSGAIIETDSNTFNLDGDHILSRGNTVSLYFFQCSKNLIAGYRCAVEGATASGPNYFIWAAWDKSDAVASAELSACEDEIKKEDATATFLYRVHP